MNHNIGGHLVKSGVHWSLMIYKPSITGDFRLKSLVLKILSLTLNHSIADCQVPKTLWISSGIFLQWLSYYMGNYISSTYLTLLFHHDDFLLIIKAELKIPPENSDFSVLLLFLMVWTTKSKTEPCWPTKAIKDKSIFHSS